MNLADVTRDSFELAAIEESIWNDLDTLAEDGELKASKQTAFVHTTTGRVGAKTHDLEDFGSRRRDLRSTRCWLPFKTSIHAAKSN